MSREREAELIDILEAYRGQELLVRVSELLTLRRRRHRDKLETAESSEVRGRAKECKDLIQILG